MQVTFTDTLATQHDYLIAVVYFTKEVNPSLAEPPQWPLLLTRINFNPSMDK